MTPRPPIGEVQNRAGTSRRGATQAPAAISPPRIAAAARPAVMVRSFPTGGSGSRHVLIGRGRDDPELLERPVADDPAPDHRRDGDRSEDPTVFRHLAVVAHHEQFALGHDPAILVAGFRPLDEPGIVMEEVWLVERDPIDEHLSVPDLDRVAADPDDALDEGLLAAGPVRRRLEHDDLSAGVGTPSARQPIHEDVVALGEPCLLYTSPSPRD